MIVADIFQTLNTYVDGHAFVALPKLNMTYTAFYWATVTHHVMIFFTICTSAEKTSHIQNMVWRYLTIQLLPQMWGLTIPIGS